jgi:hypothetical protein
MTLTAGTMTAPEAGVKVRRYRQGLGDRFLLAFPTGGPRPCYVLIDCVPQGAVDSAATLEKVAASLRDATGGKIDVLVATHRGVAPVPEVCDRIEVGEVWEAWTGDPLALPGVAGARLYVLGQVLGPPSRSGPTASALAGDSGLLGSSDLAFPFDRLYRVGFDQAKQDGFFRNRYFGEEAPAWRQIDADWLGAAGPLALRLDGGANDASLALAVELEPGGQVLRFPGDAQAAFGAACVEDGPCVEIVLPATAAPSPAR